MPNKDPQKNRDYMRPYMRGYRKDERELIRLAKQQWGWKRKGHYGISSLQQEQPKMVKAAKNMGAKT